MNAAVTFTGAPSDTSSEGPVEPPNLIDLSRRQTTPDSDKTSPPASPRAAVGTGDDTHDDGANDAAPTGVQNSAKTEATSAKKKKRGRKSKATTPKRGKAMGTPKPNSSVKKRGRKAKVTTPKRGRPKGVAKQKSSQKKKTGRKSSAAKRMKDEAEDKANQSTPKGARKRKAEAMVSTPSSDQPSTSKRARRSMVVAVRTPKASNGPKTRSSEQPEKTQQAITRSILEEINARSGEGFKVWDAQWNKESKTGIALYNVDYVVSSTAPEAEGADPVFYLYKFQSYPHPSWDVGSTTTEAHLNFKQQEEYAIEIRKALIIELGSEEEARRLYPHQYLEHEVGEGRGGYVTDPRALYFNKLKAIEHKINGILVAAGLQKICIMDWTALQFDLEGLTSFEFITKLAPLPKVKKLLEEYKLAERIVCDDGCTHCHWSHHNTKEIKCCGMQLMIKYDDSGVAEFEKAKGGQEMRERKEEGGVQFECTDLCHPDEEKRARCKNRWVQRGRQQEVVVFRDAVKGWILRSTAHMETSDFLGDYTGVVKSKASRTGTDDARYDFMMKHRLTTKDGRKQPLLNVCAFKKGNETRFISHSCNPNLAVVMSAVERNGRWFTHPTFRAIKNIPPGSELTFDYFAGEQDVDCTGMFPFCLCKSKNCRYTKEKVAEMKKRMEKERRAARERGEEAKEEEEEEEESEDEKEEQCGEDGEEREKAAEGEEEDKGEKAKKRRRSRRFEDKGDDEEGEGAFE